MARPDQIDEVSNIPATEDWSIDRTEHEDNLQDRTWGADREEWRLQDKQEARKFTEEELAQRLKDIKDINELKKVLQGIIWNMESQLINIVQEINGGDTPWGWLSYDWIWNINEDSSEEELSFFEKKWMNIINKAKNLLAQIEEWNAEVNLLTFLQQASSELYQTQNTAEEYIRTDMKDGNLSYKEFSSKESFEMDYSRGWMWLFLTHSNPNKFRELLNSKSTGEWKNIFDEIDDIAANWHDRNLDWTTDFLENQTVRGMLNNGKIDDLNKYLSTYKDNERIKENIRKELRMNIMDSMLWNLDSESFLSDFLKHFNEVKKSPMLWDIAKELEEINPTIKNFNQMETEIHKQQPDILRDWTVDALIIFDNDDLEWSWAGYFKPNIAKFKRQWYKEIEHKNSPDMEKVVLQKWNDKITLARLKEIDGDKQDESYNKALNGLKDHWYNLFALRWHCHNTSDIATRMGNLGMVSEWSIFIDWWCWNARHTDEYINWWITCPIFSYTSTWKWATTEALVDIILREKNKKGNLWTLLNSINQWINWNSPTLKWMKTMNMPDSPYTLYSLAKLRANQEYSWLTGNENFEGTSPIEETSDQDIAMISWVNDGM